jgi:phosphoribosylformimino-5-aminoimidazole carboxamide ribotide isomerase
MIRNAHADPTRIPAVRAAVQVIPVLDLMGRQVVRGVAGRRSEYRPVQSGIAKSADPGEVAEALVAKFNFQRVYVADLDAIAGGEPDWQSYRAISAAGLSLWLDAGLGDCNSARRIVEFHESGRAIERIVLGLESISAPHVLAELVVACGTQRAVFSLDLQAGRPLAAPAWQSMSPRQIAAAAVGCGIEALILLDLADVGTYQGTGTAELCRYLRQKHPKAQLIGGGGVRSILDVRRMGEVGFDGVLVASALHDGRIRREELSSLQT